MTIAIKDSDVSRRGVLAGLGGMTFCLALGVDGLRVVPKRTPTRWRMRRSRPGYASPRTAP